MNTRRYICSEYEYNGGNAPVYVKGTQELEAERIILEVSIKYCSVGATSDITDIERALIDSSASRGINYGFFWKDRPIIETPEMKEIWEVSKPFDDAFDRIRMHMNSTGTLGGAVYDLLYVKKDHDYCRYVDIRRAASLFDRRYMELKYLANPWLKYVTPKYKSVCI